MIRWDRLKTIIFVISPFLFIGVFHIYGNFATRGGISSNPINTIPKQKNLIASIDCVQVYFTNPSNSNDVPPIVSALLNFLSRAERSIYGALYDLDYEPVGEVLIDQHRLGKEVRLVIEKENINNAVILRCKNSGIEVKPDENPALMHNKFFIVDKKRVWTGSTNFTYNCLFLNDNNSVMISHEKVAKNFYQEFGEMFYKNAFGKSSPADTEFPKVHCGNTEMITLFAPEDNVEQFLIKEIESAQKSIEFLAFSFTSDPLARCLISARQRGVLVQGVLEKRNVNQQSSKDEMLHHAGINVRIDGNPKTMHNKIFIIDDSTVFTGSYNFSKNANERNDENALIFRNRLIAEQYQSVFFSLFEKATPIQ